MKSMKIGEVAKRSGIGVETIRYYEREGLLQEPERRPSGYRQYDDSTTKRLEYIVSVRRTARGVGEESCRREARRDSFVRGYG